MNEIAETVKEIRTVAKEFDDDNISALVHRLELKTNDLLDAEEYYPDNISMQLAIVEELESIVKKIERVLK